MEQRLAPLREQPPRSVHEPSESPANIAGDFSWRLLMIARGDYCDHIACNYNSSWKHYYCYPHPLNGPQLPRCAEAKEPGITHIWTKSAVGIQRGSLTLPGEESVNLRGFSPKQFLWVGRETKEACLGFSCSSCYLTVQYCYEYRIKIFLHLSANGNFQLQFKNFSKGLTHKGLYERNSFSDKDNHV